MESFSMPLKNELKLNIQNMSIAVFVVIIPLIVLVILGSIYRIRPTAEGTAYTFMEQFFGALCRISICAGGLMGLPLVASEYWGRKILKRFQATPISFTRLLAVEFTIYTIYCAVSIPALSPAAMLLWRIKIHSSFLLFLGSWFLTMISTLSVSLLVGGIAKNIKSASVVACALYLPTLIFPGAILLSKVMLSAMQKITRIFPLAQGIQLMKVMSLGLPVGNVLLPVAVMCAVTITCFSTSVKRLK